MTFLHNTCKKRLCNDCKEIAEEYAELLELRTRALQAAEYERGQLKKELEKTKRMATMYEQVAKAGVGDIISAWLDQNFEKLLKQESTDEPIKSSNHSRTI